MSLRRPLAGVALVVILGMWCGADFAAPRLLPPSFAIAALAIAALCHIAAPRREALTRLIEIFADVSLYLAIFFSAWFWISLNLNNPSDREIAALMRKPREGVEISGVVCNDPVVFTSQRADRAFCLFDLDAEDLHRARQPQKARGRVRVFLRMDQRSTPPAYGERLRIAGALKDNGAINPEVVRSAPRYTLSASSTACVTLSGGHGWLFRKLCLDMRRAAALSLEIGIHHKPDVSALLRALILGYRQDLDEHIKLDFQATGAYHILAISGIHVAILALFVITLLGATGVSRVHWFLFLAPCLLLFMFATGGRASTVRGAIMALVFFLGTLVNRKTDIVSAMALAALLILGFDPTQMFDRGFILSFVVIGGLVALCPALFAHVERLTQPDPMRLQPEHGLVSRGRRVVRIVLITFATSLAAWLSSVPLIAMWFNMVTPSAPFSNLVIVPLLPLILLAGWLAVFFGPWLPLAAEIFNFANVFLVSILTEFIRMVAAIPFARFFVETPPIWSILLWYAVLLGWGLKKRVIWIPCAVFLVLLAGVGFLVSARGVSVDVMNLGGRAVCFVNVPGEGDILVNAGSRFNGPQAEQWLRSKGVDRLHALALTLADADHSGGAGSIIESIPVQELWCATTNMRSSVFMDAIALARNKGLAVRELTQGETGRLRGDVEWTVLHPRAEARRRSAGEAVLLLLFRRGSASLLLGGELPIPQDAAGEGNEAIDVLVAKQSGAAGRVDAADPGAARFGLRVICVSCDYPDWSPGPRNEGSVTSRDIILRPGEEVRVHLSSRGGAALSR